MKLLLTITCILLMTHAQSQPIAPTWEASLGSNVKWMEVNDWGTLIVSAADGLYGINPEDGTQQWKVPEVANVKNVNYRPIPGSPLVTIKDGPLFLVINGQNGQVLLNSVEEGFEKILFSEALPELQGMLIEYKMGSVKGLALMNLLDGSFRWKNNFDDFKGGSELQPGPRLDKAGHILYPFGKNLLKLHADTGEVLWQVASSRAIKDLFFDPSGDRIIAVSGSVSNTFRQDNTDGDAGSVSGNVGKFSVRSVDTSDGQVAWSHDYKSKYAGVAASEKDFALFHASSFNFIDFASGEKRWAKEPKASGGDRNEALIVTDEGILAAMLSGITGKVYFYYLDHEGNKLWKKTPYTTGQLYYMEWVEGGLLYASEMGANILIKASGKDLWEGDEYLRTGSQPVMKCEDDEGNPILLTLGNAIRIRPDQGKWETLAGNLNLYGDFPTTFTKIPQGYQITAAQNVIRIDENGKLLFHTYYPAPEQSLGKKLLLSAVSIAVATTSVATAGMASVGYGAVGVAAGDNNALEKSDGYGDLFNVGADAAGAISAAGDRRFKEQIDAVDYKLILTTKNKKIGLIKVDLETGEETGFVVTEDRTPEYVLDEVGGQLFFKTSAQRIASYGM